MHDERDAEDVRLLEAGDHAELLAAYHDVVVGRCVARLRWPSGYDAAQDVFERLLTELRKGKTYPVPYRVVVEEGPSWPPSPATVEHLLHAGETTGVEFKSSLRVDTLNRGVPPKVIEKMAPGRWPASRTPRAACSSSAWTTTGTPSVSTVICRR